MKPRSITTWLKKSKSRRFFFKKLAAFLFGEVRHIADQTKRSRDSGTSEEVQSIPLTLIHPFKDHPFRVVDDALMQQTIDSIRQVGILSPVILRPIDDGYEMVSGHRRMHAAQFAGLTEIPAVVRDMTDEEAVIFMVDSNLQREEILPSERAKAYQMKMEAIKKQAGRPTKNSVQVGQNFDGKTSRDRIAENAPDSPSQVRRYIRLTNLDPQLLQMVDDGKIGLTPAVELSYLNPEEQKLLVETIDSEQATPSLSQAQRMRKLSGEGKLNDDRMLGIMSEQKKPEIMDIKLPLEQIRKYFPRSFTPLQMEKTIFKLLDAWQKKRQRENER